MYKQYRENCPYFKTNGVHRVVKGHNTCCADDNVEVTGGKPLSEYKKGKVEMWREEYWNNENAIETCCRKPDENGVYPCPRIGTDNCNERDKKNKELEHFIARERRYLNRV